MYVDKSALLFFFSASTTNTNTNTTSLKNKSEIKTTAKSTECNKLYIQTQLAYPLPAVGRKSLRSAQAVWNAQMWSQSHSWKYIIVMKSVGYASATLPNQCVRICVKLIFVRPAALWSWEVKFNKNHICEKTVWFTHLLVFPSCELLHAYELLLH